MSRIGRALLLLLASCTSPPTKPTPVWREVCQSYQAEIPTGWSILQEEETLFTLGRDRVEVTLRLSPPEIKDRPQKVVLNWSQGLNGAIPGAIALSHEAHNGFAGLSLFVDNGQSGLLGWAMELDPSFGQEPKGYTVRAFGPLSEVEEHRLEIEKFARSIELVNEL